MVNTTTLRQKATAVFLVVEKPAANNISQTMREAANEIDTLRAAMQEFVDRCDKGEVRSTKTYNKFKTLLGGTDDKQNPV